MPRDWTALADKSDTYEVEDFKSAAYRLVTEQALYEDSNKQRLSYRIIKEHENAYREVCALLGMNLTISAGMGFCCASPVHVRNTPLPLAQTLLVLVLRKLYHQAMASGQTEQGRALVSVEELNLTYEKSTNRTLPTSRKELTALMGVMKRFGIARTRRTEPGDPQPLAIEILPTIEVLIDEGFSAELDAHAKTQSPDLDSEPEEEKDEDNDERA